MLLELARSIRPQGVKRHSRYCMPGRYIPETTSLQTCSSQAHAQNWLHVLRRGDDELLHGMKPTLGNLTQTPYTNWYARHAALVISSVICRSPRKTVRMDCTQFFMTKKLLTNTPYMYIYMYIYIYIYVYTVVVKSLYPKPVLA